MNGLVVSCQFERTQPRSKKKNLHTHAGDSRIDLPVDGTKALPTWSKFRDRRNHVSLLISILTYKNTLIRTPIRKRILQVETTNKKTQNERERERERGGGGELASKASVSEFETTRIRTKEILSARKLNLPAVKFVFYACYAIFDFDALWKFSRMGLVVSWSFRIKHFSDRVMIVSRKLRIYDLSYLRLFASRTFR